MDIFDNEMMRKMIKKALAQKLGELPPEAKAALKKTRVQVVRKPDRIEIVIDDRDDPDVEKAGSVFLDSLLQPLAWIITMFGCQASVETASGQ